MLFSKDSKGRLCLRCQTFFFFRNNSGWGQIPWPTRPIFCLEVDLNVGIFNLNLSLSEVEFKMGVH